jgi:hypothetical protein
LAIVIQLLLFSVLAPIYIAARARTEQKSDICPGCANWNLKGSQKPEFVKD